ncbi:MAG: hypothetical protein ACM31I_01530 [Deltaproteobacteria bacterium]
MEIPGPRADPSCRAGFRDDSAGRKKMLPARRKTRDDEGNVMERHPIRSWVFLLVFTLGLAVGVEQVEAGGPADTPTGEQLIAYKKLLLRTFDEAVLDLPYGALKEKELSKEEKEKRMSMATRKVMGTAQSGTFHSLLEFYDGFYGTIYHRLLLLANDEIKSPPLLAWHLKLVMGYKDCRRVTADALAEVVRSGRKDIGYNEQVQRAVGTDVRVNDLYFRVLKEDLEALLRTALKDEAEIRNYVDRFTPLLMYIELTWK